MTVIRTIWSNLLAMLFGCAHRRRTFPMHNVQTCLDCGAARRYVIGETPGNWWRTEATQ